mmetsp:Transcript_22202/g.61609  ORF Transcript_22202/g.61609 Transcript_22202/m.61609 type:complete len:211 (+) Transcript_22202:761-1393(+)
MAALQADVDVGGGQAHGPLPNLARPDCLPLPLRHPVHPHPASLAPPPAARCPSEAQCGGDLRGGAPCSLPHPTPLEACEGPGRQPSAPAATPHRHLRQLHLLQLAHHAALPPPPRRHPSAGSLGRTHLPISCSLQPRQQPLLPLCKGRAPSRSGSGLGRHRASVCSGGVAGPTPPRRPGGSTCRPGRCHCQHVCCRGYPTGCRCAPDDYP